MLSRQRLMMASITLLLTQIHGITLSLDLHTQASLFTLGSKTIIKPAYSDDALTEIQFLPYSEKINPSFYLEASGMSIHGDYPYSDHIHFYAQVGLQHDLGLSYNHHDYLFSLGSLRLTPNYMPSIEVGANYQTQSGARIEGGLQYTHVFSDLSTVSEGALFHGWPETGVQNLGMNALSLHLKTAFPITEQALFYIGGAMGLESFSTTLPTKNNLSSAQTCALINDPHSDPLIGNLYGSSIKLAVDSLYLGVRFNITDIYS